jgi:hypothetical protein
MEASSAQLSNEFPVDPGSHTIVAKVGGKEYLHETLSLAEKETKTFEVKLTVAPPRLVVRDVPQSAITSRTLLPQRGERHA